MARYKVKVIKKQFGDGKGQDRQIKVVGVITFRSKGVKQTLKESESPHYIVTGVHEPIVMQKAVDYVKGLSYDLAKKINESEGEEIQKDLNKKARSSHLVADSKFI